MFILKTPDYVMFDGIAAYKWLEFNKLVNLGFLIRDLKIFDLIIYMSKG